MYTFSVSFPPDRYPVVPACRPAPLPLLRTPLPLRWPDPLRGACLASQGGAHAHRLPPPFRPRASRYRQDFGHPFLLRTSGTGTLMVLRCSCHHKLHDPGKLPPVSLCCTVPLHRCSQCSVRVTFHMGEGLGVHHSCRHLVCVLCIRCRCYPTREYNGRLPAFTLSSPRRFT